MPGLTLRGQGAALTDGGAAIIKTNGNRGAVKEMSVYGIGSAGARDYSSFYNASTAGSHSGSGEVKEAVFSEKADRTVKTNCRADSAPACTEWAAEDKNLPAQKDETTFPISSVIAKYAKYTKVIDEHYAKVNEENKKFDNPSGHIWDKYYNTKSPYFVKGLTQKEREICADSERRVLNGLPAAVNNYDPVIQETFGGIMSDAEWNEEVREDINDSVNRLFEENKIVIPRGTDLRLRVDPYDYEIHVSGVEEELAERIEKALNRGDNGKYLYEHLSWCNPARNGYEQPKQYLYDTAYQEKAAMWHFVKDMTGLDMRELENRDGVIYTPEGQNLWDVVTNRYNELRAEGRIDVLSIGSLYKDYRIFAKEGWKDGEECGLSIGYKNGSLYDVDTEYGYGPGQREWLDTVKKEQEEYRENYREEKAEITLLTQPDIRAMQQLLDYAVRSGNVIPLTEEILHLPGRETVQGGFDVKA